MIHVTRCRAVTFACDGTRIDRDRDRDFERPGHDGTLPSVAQPLPPAESLAAVVAPFDDGDDTPTP